MNASLVRAYKQSRKEDPYRPAQYAFLNAKVQTKPLAFDWSSRHDLEAKYTPDEKEPWSYKIRVEYDDENLHAFTDDERKALEWAGGDYKNLRYYQNPNVWHDGEKSRLCREYAYILPFGAMEDSYRWDCMGGWAKIPKHIERERIIRDLTKTVQAVVRDEYSAFTVWVTAYYKGEEVSEECLGANYFSRTGSRERETEDLVLGNGMIEEARANGEKRLQELRKKLCEV